MTLAEFRRAYPTAAFTVSGGKPFTYRYYQNPQPKPRWFCSRAALGCPTCSISTLPGSPGIFSVLTFDYQLQFGDNGEFADAVAELLAT